MKREFKKYVKKFDLKDSKIKYKYAHSYRVMCLSKYLAKHENFSKEEIKLMELIGLLHDIGRFKQLEKFDSYSDKDTIDHADLGVEILKKDNYLSKFYKNKKYYVLVYDAIQNHNKFKIDESIKKENIKYCKIIRDADKIDIILSYYINFIKIGEEGNISVEVIKDFKKEKLVDLASVKTEADEILKNLSYIYDINYQTSFKYLKNKNIINKIYNDVIKDKEKFKEYFCDINEYIERKIKNVRNEI